MDMSKYRGMFLSETREHLDNMNRLIISLEQNPRDRAGIDSLFREAHSIKGMAASMGFSQMNSLAHYLEDFLDRFRTLGELPAEVFNRLLAGVDLLEQLLEDITAERPERGVDLFIRDDSSPLDDASSPDDTLEEVADKPATETFNLVVTLADQAIAPAARGLLLLKECNRLGQLVESRPTLPELSRGGNLKTLSISLQSRCSFAQIESTLAGMPDVERIDLQKSTHEEPVLPFRKDDLERTVRIRTELLDKFINLTGELITNRTMLQNASRQQDWPGLSEGLDQLTRLVADLHFQVLQVRMMPLKSITGRLPRLMRELCQALGKEIRLEISGEDIELDRSILEKLSDPLVHLLRNAADHGIEQSGIVTLRAWREKDLVLIELTDDGRGINPLLIRDKAIECGLLSRAQAEQLAEADLLMLVCHPGLSTRDAVTETSGRGVGMDIVKSSVESAGGALELSLLRSGGTRALLKLPLSVAIIRVLLLQCAEQIMALPITRVLRTLELPREALQRSGRQLVTSFEDQVLPLLSLRNLLKLDPQPEGATVPIIVTEVRGRKIGLMVDQLVGQQEAFVKALDFPLNKVAGIAGATVLGTGQVVFVLDPLGFLDAVRITEKGDEG